MPPPPPPSSASPVTTHSANLRMDEGPGQVSAAPFDGSVEAVKPSRWADYQTLCKTRLNVMVLITTAVGYHMAAKESFHWKALLHVLIGTALTAASSAVLNQWMEIDRDRQMPRTRNRPLPAGRISPTEGLILGLLLGIVGLGYLLVMTNPMTFALGLATLGSYLLVYTPLKPVSTLNTIVGAIPGALPPVMGWAAASGALVGPGAGGAWALFAILFLWQMPHFLAIATLYREDYRTGGYMMLPVVDEDLSATSRQALIYLGVLVAGSLMPTFAGMAGVTYAVVALVLSTAFLLSGVQFAMTRTRKDARTMFFVSITYLPLLLGVMVFDKR